MIKFALVSVSGEGLMNLINKMGWFSSASLFCDILVNDSDKLCQVPKSKAQCSLAANRRLVQMLRAIGLSKQSEQLPGYNPSFVALTKDVRSLSRTSFNLDYITEHNSLLALVYQRLLTAPHACK